MEAIDLLPSPSYTIKANSTMDGTNPIHEASPSWCVCIIPFQEPVSSFATDVENAMVTKRPIIIENDAIQVSVSRPKGSFAKTASITVKISDVYYQNACSNGDWIAIWMSDWQEDIDRIITKLQSNATSGLNDWESGLKFVGRIIGIDAAQSIASGGQYIQVQTITAQAFLELATSLYHTFLTQALMYSTKDVPSGQTTQTASTDMLNAKKQQINENNLKSALGNTSSGFERIFQIGTSVTPDQTISNLILLTLGIPSRTNLYNSMGLFGTPNDAIMIPTLIGNIIGRPRKKYLWETMNFIFGLQKYTSQGSTWRRFFPDTSEIISDPNNNMFFSPFRLKGLVQYMPPSWNNQTIWSVWQQYLNPLLNEMYTCLRIDKFNKIVPTVVVREQPFSTGLFNYLQNGRPMDRVRTASSDKAPSLLKRQSDADTTVINVFPSSPTELKNRTMFHNLPRWKIDDSMIMGVNVSTSESARVNFVQVFAQNTFTSFGVEGNLIEAFKSGHLQMGNFVIDEQDIRRNGLRAAVFESEFGGEEVTGALIADNTAPSTKTGYYNSAYWAKIKADWLFNGHLKLAGSIQCQGIKEPICEGDNVQVNGILYHIDNISFSGSISSVGSKSFKTNLSVSNGLLASSLSDTKAPLYPIHQTSNPLARQSGPSVTDIQATTVKNRTPDGERRD